MLSAHSFNATKFAIAVSVTGFGLAATYFGLKWLMKVKIGRAPPLKLAPGYPEELHPGGLMERWMTSVQRSGDYNNFALCSLLSGPELKLEDVHRAVVNLLRTSTRARCVYHGNIDEETSSNPPEYHIVGRGEDIRVVLNWTEWEEKGNSKKKQQQHNSAELSHHVSFSSSSNNKKNSAYNNVELSFGVSFEGEYRRRELAESGADIWWQTIFQEENAVPVAATAPSSSKCQRQALFRVHLVTLHNDETDKKSSSSPNQAILIAFYHGNTDGMSGAFFMQKLLDGLNDEPSIPTCVQRGALPMSMVSDIRPTIGFILDRFLWREKFVGLFSRKIQGWLLGEGWLGDEPHLREEERFGEARFVKIDNVDRLVEQCRWHGTTVHAAVIAACVYATNFTAGRPVRSQIDTAVNVRKLAGVPEKSEGVYITAIETKCNPLLSESIRPGKRDIAFKDFWQIATASKENLSKKTPFGPRLVGLTALIDGNCDEFQHEAAAKSPSGRDSSVLTTNLGRIEFQREYGNQHLHAVWFGATHVQQGGVFVISSITVENSFYSHVSFVKETIRPEQVDEFIRVFKMALEWVKTGGE